MNEHTDKEFQPVPSGWNFSSIRLKLQFRPAVTSVPSRCNQSSAGLQLWLCLYATVVLSVRTRLLFPVFGPPPPPVSSPSNGRSGVKNRWKWWQQPFFPHKKRWCHHPLRGPVHRGFRGLGGSSGSSFAKLCCRCFVNRPGVHGILRICMWNALSSPARTSLSFRKRMRPFSKKMTVFF